MKSAAAIDGKEPATAEFGRAEINAYSTLVMRTGQDARGPERILGRLRPERGEGPHVPLLRAALDESRREGTFSHLAPIMEDLANAHVDFFNHVAEVTAGQVGGKMQFPYSRVKDAFDNAVNRLMPFLPPNAVRFDEEYPWDGRHESSVLCRDLLASRQSGPEGKCEDRLNPEHGN